MSCSGILQGLLGKQVLLASLTRLPQRFLALLPQCLCGTLQLLLQRLQLLIVHLWGQAGKAPQKQPINSPARASGVHILLPCSGYGDA